MAATVTAEVTLGELNASFEELRKADKELRERLFVLQVARKFDWDAANKMARRKAGDYDDPELAKVLEEREKKEEKSNATEKKKEPNLLIPPTRREAVSRAAVPALHLPETVTKDTQAH